MSPRIRVDSRFVTTVVVAGGLLAVFFGLTKPAAADTLTLGTGISQIWDRSSLPSASPAMTLTMFNDTDNPNGIMLAFTLGMRLEPTAGATGSLAVGSVTNPATNPIFPVISQPTVNPQPAQGFTSILVENSDVFTPVPVPQAGGNAIEFRVTSSDAVGTFNIVLDGTQSRTGWNDDSDEFPFGNADNTLLTVGQITVVPEPATLGLAGIASALGGFAVARRIFWRRGRPVEKETAATC